MDGADLPSPSSSTAGAGARRPEGAGEGSGADGERAASPPERCEALAAAIAGVLGGALREHEARAAATARSQDEVAAAADRLNGELDKLLENAPSLVIMQHSTRISTIRKRISALNMLLKSIQRRIDNIDRIISTGLTSDHSSPVQYQSLK
ncbi:uncharacterized protein LOC120677620 [Panicum virgatum]|uniref:Biogenesis of lysosome-related organelles complex 1 subunit 7 n=1 Tax=Panicum virgatum TaxID=38727 RepID=A0A8T0QU47_PANVG|nr:uncharacterized protein LOC120677620 [Panicum virgatum]KAG2576503.1 hypothetical protein PVAP13_6NG024083 [Panicum virgatum]